MNDTAKRIREKGINLVDRDFLLFQAESLLVPDSHGYINPPFKAGVMAMARLVDEATLEYPPEGYWIKTEEFIGDGKYGAYWYECSDCGASSAVDYEYCPYCGTRMVKDENKTM